MGVFCSLCALTSHVASSQDIDLKQWKLSEKGAELIEKDNQKVVKMSRGEMTWQGGEFQDGSIEFEMYSEGERAFVYAYFREQSQDESEVIYLRTHKSNLPDTVQYSPVYQGRSAWQLYHGNKGTAPASLPAFEWVKVKLSVSGDKLSMWVGEDPKPVFDKVLLTGPKQKGTVTLRGFVPGASSATYANYFRNISILPEAPAANQTKQDQETRTGQIMQLSVSNSFAADKAAVTQIPEAILKGERKVIAAQPDGLFEFLRDVPIAESLRSYAVLAETVLKAGAAQQCILDIGFSDALTLMLNGQPLLHSDASYRFSDNRQEGLLHEQQVSVYLPLIAGKNFLQAVVADSFGGWGFKARLRDCANVTVSTP